MGKSHKIIDHTYSNENPQHDQEFTLLGKVGLTCFPDNVGHLKHGFVSRKLPGLTILDYGKNQTDNTDDKTEIHDGKTTHTTKGSKLHLIKGR